MKFLENIAEYVDPIENMLKEADSITFEELVSDMNEEQAKKYSELKEYMSERNYKDAYIVNVRNQRVILNHLPQKRMASDSEFRKVQDHRFDYFEDVDYEDILTPEFTLSEGDLFRVANEGIKPKEDYQYYAVKDGVVHEVPNYKTLEVMLVERGKTYEFVKVIEVPQYEALMKASEKGNASGNAANTDGLDEEVSSAISKKPSGGGVSDRSSEWTEDIAQQTTFETFEDLQQNSEEAEGIMEGAIEQADATMEEVQQMLDDAENEEEED